MDAGLREELIERVAEFADQPVNFLRRSCPPEPIGLWVFEYRSRVVDGLRIVLFLDAMDARRKTIALVAVGHVMDDDEPD